MPELLRRFVKTPFHPQCLRQVVPSRRVGRLKANDVLILQNRLGVIASKPEHLAEEPIRPGVIRIDFDRLLERIHRVVRVVGVLQGIPRFA